MPEYEFAMIKAECEDGTFTSTGELVFNVYFTAIGHEVDYFFINSDFIADKLGNWAENIFNITAAINIGGHELNFHPIYQSLFFLTYVSLGLAVWFVYSEF